MVWGKNELRKEKLKQKVRYHRLTLTKNFEKQLEKRKKELEEKIMAQDCKSWKSTDLLEAKRGMEVSVLKYRLAKEQGQQARRVLDDLLEEVRPYIMDAHGLEEEVWKYFDGDSSGLYADDTEKEEAEAKLQESGFQLKRLLDRDQVNWRDDDSTLSDEDEQHVLTEVVRVQQETDQLLDELREKKAQLAALRRNAAC